MGGRQGDGRCRGASRPPTHRRDQGVPDRPHARIAAAAGRTTPAAGAAGGWTVRRWLRLGPETHELRVVLTDLFDGGHTRTEYRCVGDDGRPLRGHRWDDLDGRRVDYDAASGRGCLVTGVFSTHRVWLDLERRPVVDGRLTAGSSTVEASGSRATAIAPAPHCREADVAWEATAAGRRRSTWPAALAARPRPARPGRGAAWPRLAQGEPLGRGRAMARGHAVRGRRHLRDWGERMVGGVWLTIRPKARTPSRSAPWPPSCGGGRRPPAGDRRDQKSVFVGGLGGPVAEMEGAVVEDFGTRELEPGRTRTVGEESLPRSKR